MQTAVKHYAHILA